MIAKLCSMQVAIAHLATSPRWTIVNSQKQIAGTASSALHRSRHDYVFTVDRGLCQFYFSTGITPFDYFSVPFN